ncbi:MAG: VapC toxin family PIN domain ribonuclease [Anaerolinea sp.]|nr:VapC toxin family PIN domain ribonuclease [Anaerolinea sp.]
MKYLLDTPLLAELLRARPEDWISHWIDAFNEDEVYLSAVTIKEINTSIEKIEEVNQKKQLHAWLKNELMVRFHGKIIPINEDVFTEWKKLAAETGAIGKPLSAMDGLIAATVRARGLVLITYNREIFAEAGIEVSDPWQG